MLHQYFFLIPRYDRLAWPGILTVMHLMFCSNCHFCLFSEIFVQSIRRKLQRFPVWIKTFGTSKEIFWNKIKELWGSFKLFLEVLDQTLGVIQNNGRFFGSHPRSFWINFSNLLKITRTILKQLWSSVEQNFENV